MPPRLTESHFRLLTSGFCCRESRLFRNGCLGAFVATCHFPLAPASCVKQSKIQICHSILEKEPSNRMNLTWISLSFKAKGPSGNIRNQPCREEFWYSFEPLTNTKCAIRKLLTAKVIGAGAGHGLTSKQKVSLSPPLRGTAANDLALWGKSGSKFR